MADITQKQMLIETHTDVKWLKEMFQKHLDRHFQVVVLSVGALLSAVTALIISLLTI